MLSTGSADGSGIEAVAILGPAFQYQRCPVAYLHQRIAEGSACLPIGEATSRRFFEGCLQGGLQ
jgi:hypothetical protein